MPAYVKLIDKDRGHLDHSGRPKVEYYDSEECLSRSYPIGKLLAVYIHHEKVYELKLINQVKLVEGYREKTAEDAKKWNIKRAKEKLATIKKEIEELERTF